MIHPLAWEALVGDDCDDALRMERLAFWLPDTVGNSSEREAVLQSYEQLAWRRLHRWQRILVWPLPEPAALCLVNLLYHRTEFSCTAADSDFDPSLFGLISNRVLDHPPLCVKRMSEPPPAYLPPRLPHSGLSNRRQAKKASEEFLDW
ncbi:uncharacterized protein JCM10292_001961 [Rhodotorula paludigena]|uniref:uncharacterized protein n=1 Tax=Rhodotorula paludigena TaxID=86838 RepID=UPI003171AC11